ncbi:MAG: thioredoxin family protein [Leptospira sp.]|nr:thioredoxin family protein [Leptospira sp.]
MWLQSIRKLGIRLFQSFLFFSFFFVFINFSPWQFNELHSQTKKQSNGIVWQTSILKAMELAKEQDKPIFVELYAEWCNYCKTLEREIFPDAEVTKALSQFVTVRLNGEEYPNFMQRYEARGYPTLLFLDKYSNFIAKLPGMPTKEMVIRVANQALANSNIEEKLLANFKKDPKSLRNHFELGIFYYQSENYPLSASYFQKTTELKGSGDSGEDDLKRQSLYNLALIQMNQGNYTLAVSTWNKYIVKYKNNDSLASAYLHRGIAWRERKENSRARKDLLKAQSISKIPEELEMIQEELNSLK